MELQFVFLLLYSYQGFGTTKMILFGYGICTDINRFRDLPTDAAAGNPGENPHP